MIKLLLSAFLLFSISYSTELNKVEYSIALKAYNEKNYELSYKLFDKLFLNNLENVEVNFYLAKSLFKLKQYNEAIASYERILIQKDSPRVNFEIARCYFMQKNYIEAKSTFLAVKDDVTSQKLKSSIEIYLKKIDERLSKNSFGGLFIVGIGYDSNLNNRADSDTYNINGLIFDNTTKDETAFFHQEIAILKHKYKYSVQSTIKNNIMIYNKGILNHTDKNVQLLSYTPSLSYMYTSKFIVDYALLSSRLWYGKELYLDSIGLNPKIKYIYSDNLILNSGYKYQKKLNIIDENKDRDSEINQILFGITKRITPLVGISSSIVFEKERKIQGTLSDIDFDSSEIRFSVKYQVTSKLVIIPKLSYKNKEYKDIDTTYNKKQKNDEYNINLSGTYMLNKGWTAQGLLNYSDINSNIISSEYKKYTVGINFIKPF